MNELAIKMAIETTTSCQLVQNFIVCAVETFETLLFVQSRHSKLYCLCSRDIQNFIVCAVATFKTLLFVQSRHSKLYCLCSRDIQNFIVCAVATFKTLLFVQSRHSKLYCLCSRDIRNFIVCAVATFKTLLFVQSSHSKLFSLRVPSGAPYETYLGSKQNIFLKKTPFSSQLGQANLISGSTDPTDPVFAESRKKIKNGPKIFICM